MAQSIRRPKQFAGFCNVIYARKTVSNADLAAGADRHTNVTVVGAALGDLVLFAAGVDVIDMMVSAQVTADDVVTVSIVNETGDNQALASSTWNFLIIKPKSDWARQAAD